MAELIACPLGITLPYSSIFNTSLRLQSKRPSQSTPSSYYWNKATQDSPSHGDAEQPHRNSIDILMSDHEDEPSPKQKKPERKSKHLRLKLRKIAFKAFTPKADGSGQKNNVVRTTEILSRQEVVKSGQQDGSGDLGENGRFSILRSWRLKTKSGKAQLQKMVAVVKHRVSANSPPEDKPKTWEEFHYLYANEHIDVHNPPLPPMEPAKEGEAPTAFESRFFPAPKPFNQPVRQLVLNRLGICGPKGYDGSEKGAAIANINIELGDQLMQRGKAPTSLDMPWDCRTSLSSDGPDPAAVRSPLVPNSSAPSQTLEQHPVFRRIVQRCRELFQVSVGILSILDDERQIFLAESGLDSVPQLKGLREVTRDITFCAHTVLSGRKGFTCLDTHKDWRFQNGPLVQSFGLRFYAGVPLMAPNLDGSAESEANACPIGTLCLVDWEPREEFSSEDRKKLVYLSEYARREIEKWFAKRMEHKIDSLEASKETWKEELQRIDSDSSDGLRSMEPEVLSEIPQNGTLSRKPIFRSASSGSHELTSESSYADNFTKSPMKTKPGIFEDVNWAVKPTVRKVFDLATKLVAETLDLSLVYLAAAAPHNTASELGRTVIISGYNVPDPVPFFDTALHLKALRTPEGGLLYQNPSIEESEKEGLQFKSSTPQVGDSRTNTFASAMLLAVSSKAEHNGGGFILAGYTDDPKRVFGAEDVSYMKQFAHELSRYTNKLRF